MLFMQSSYDASLVLASLLIATLASYVTLDLAKRVRSADSAVARSWWIGGSLAMGTGIWAMHFVGMFAYSLSIDLGYRVWPTVLSWVAAAAVSAIALGLASRRRLTPLRLGAGALTMGLGICAMHYIGMAALDMAPGIVWDWRLVGASALIAVGASAAALLIFFWLRAVGGQRGWVYQIGAAAVMGAAISGMHYTGMAAAGFPQGSVCLSANDLAGDQMGGLIILASVALLVLTLFTSTLDARAQSRASQLTASLQSANKDLQSANEELQRRAFLDPLTGLANRLLFEDRLQHALARCERNTHARGGSRRLERLAVLCIDLDGFKPVNDSLGHSAGDEVLRVVAQRLRSSARESGTTARIGGDEFMLLMEDVNDSADAIAVAQRLLKTLEAPIFYQQQALHISASVGIAIYPEHGTDKLMQHADAAMYAAKRAGGKTFVVFEEHMDARAAEQMALQADLRQALANNELSLHYQPKFDCRRGQLRGVEALLRWNHPQRGSVPPTVFIAVAERFGLINTLGNWVIDEACRQIQAWDHQGLRLRVAINLSVHQLRQADLAERIEGALKRHEVDPERLLCEITESVAMEDTRSSLEAFQRLQGIGVYLAIDDFGTGYSSLSYLRQIPARQLKVDRSFIHDLETSADARAVVDAVIQLAHGLSLVVVAEGVETAAQRDILITMGCDELQGYLLAHPMSAGSVMEWASGRKPEGAAAFSPSIYGSEL